MRLSVREARRRRDSAAGVAQRSDDSAAPTPACPSAISAGSIAIAERLLCRAPPACARFRRVPADAACVELQAFTPHRLACGRSGGRADAASRDDVFVDAARSSALLALVMRAARCGLLMRRDPGLRDPAAAIALRVERASASIARHVTPGCSRPLMEIGARSRAAAASSAMLDRRGNGPAARDAGAGRSLRRHRRQYAISIACPTPPRSWPRSSAGDRRACRLPYPALHATHGGIWLATADGHARGRPRRGDPLAAETPMILLNAPLVGQRLGYPELVRARPARALRLRPSGALRGADAARAWRARSGWSRPRATMRGRRLPARGGGGAARRCSAGRLARARGRLDRGAGARPAALAVGAGRSRPLIAKPRARRALAVLASCPNGRRRAPRPAAAPDRLIDAGRRSTRLGASDRRRRRGARRASAPMPPPPRAPSLRARARGGPIWCWPRRAPGSARRFGYLAPASLWAEQAGGAVWVSTYTKALQRQLAHESARLFPDAGERARRRS